MRSAAAQDLLKKVVKRKNKIALTKLSLKNVRGIGNLEIAFSENVMAICGENGAGKTTLLKAIFSALAPGYAQSQGINLRAQDANVPYVASPLFSVRNDAGAYVEVSNADQIAALICPEGDTPKVQYVDAALASQRIKYVIRNDGDFESALEGAPQITDDSITLDWRKTITGRSYSEVKTYEIEEYGNEPVFPYFEVTTAGVTYRSEDMGQGELCINYLVWALQRIPSESFLLLEEPESHLPPRAQEALMSYIMHRCDQSKITAILSTHSQHTLKGVPLKNLALLARAGANVISQVSPLQTTLHESLKIVPFKPILVITEDRSAAEFLIALMQWQDDDFFDHLDVTWVQGWSDINEILTRLPKELKKIKIVGVYDGDQRDQLREHLHWPYKYLPGTGDPAEYMVAATKANTQAFADMWPDRRGDIAIALAMQAETDSKDYFLNLKNALGGGFDFKELYRAATYVWLTVPANQQSALQFLGDLREAIKS
ncbi:hypothetical protein hmeg3_13665 [Herbaspirillum sp. meg3]|uniref:ATP-dependent nuclease n=1 Tax=Herbaspirillum sp. meg3 TaxID=2025949 RepID=UPI000B989342|nr:AAA family ATPase [Herbaspirillum sp. meg3]ASU39230.1 hypothetical protein hmeg3_13665 [Herbaspirillum sp. meg3]